MHSSRPSTTITFFIYCLQSHAYAHVVHSRWSIKHLKDALPQLSNVRVLAEFINMKRTTKKGGSSRILQHATELRKRAEDIEGKGTYNDREWKECRIKREKEDESGWEKFLPQKLIGQLPSHCSEKYQLTPYHAYRGIHEGGRKKGATWMSPKGSEMTLNYYTTAVRDDDTWENIRHTARKNGKVQMHDTSGSL